MIDLSCNNVIFRQYRGDSHLGDSIIATSPEGNVYKFKNIEISVSVNGVGYAPNYIYNLNEILAINNKRVNTSAYYLSEILAPNGECVKFYYKTFLQLINDHSWKSHFPNYSSSDNEYMQDGYYPQVPALFEECSINSYLPLSIMLDWNYMIY